MFASCFMAGELPITTSLACPELTSGDPPIPTRQKLVRRDQPGFHWIAPVAGDIPSGQKPHGSATREAVPSWIPLWRTTRCEIRIQYGDGPEMVGWY